MRALCLTDRPVSPRSTSGLGIWVRLLSVLATAAVVTGCVPSFTEDVTPEMTLASTRTWHELSQSKLAHLSEQELSEWFRSIASPSRATRPESLRVTAFGPWSSRRQTILKHEAARMGIPQKQLRFERHKFNDGHSQPAILIEKTIVVYAGCPPREDSNPTAMNSQEFPQQLGCSTVANLGRIVADPADLSQ
jgi:type IV pilus biogenesis protein CpaD/CtpE